VLARRIEAAVRVRARRLLLKPVGLPLAHFVRRAAELSSRRVGVALVYHRVGDPAGDPTRELVPALGSALFSAQVNHLARHYRVVRASQLLAETYKRRRGDPFPVAITLDDDLAAHAEVAAPILVGAGATGTFFVSAASLGGPHRFWWERLQAAVDARLDLSGIGLAGGSIHELGRQIENMLPHERDEVDATLARLVGPDPEDSGLRADAVRRIFASGLEIGFHTRRHDLMTQLDDDRLHDAMHSGVAELADIVGTQIRTIAYPHGSAGTRVAQAARDAGFEAGFTGSRTAVTERSDPLLLGRISPSYRSLGELAFDVGWTLLRTVLSGRA
jgi:peptidoglycan/xylan/chitin deacetylase (PgdA/CDA1 family)